MKPLNSKKESTKQRRRKMRNRLISVLTAAVVFATTYSLVLPAITMDAATAEAMPGVDVAPAETAPAAAEPVAAEPIAAEPVAAAPAEAAPAVEPAAEAAPAEAPAAETSTEIIADESVPMAAPKAADAVVPEPVKSESVVSESSTSASSTSADSTEAADPAAEEKKDDAAEEQKDEEKEEEKEDEAKFAASPLTFDCAEYLVTVSFGEDAALPAGTTLGIREYGAGSMEYNAYHAILNQKLKEDGIAEEDLAEAVSALRLFEISFADKDGAQIRPAGAVNVLVEYKTPTNPVADESLYAVTFRTDDGQPTKATFNTMNAADGSACIEAAGGVIQKLRVQGFAAYDTHTNYVIGQLALNVEKEEATEEHELITTLDDEEESITTPYLTADGEAYNITMTYGPEAGIPDGAELAVSEIVEATDTYDEYVSKTEEALGENEKVTFARFFDITIMYEGAEIQPNGPVNVKIELADAITEEVKVVHFEHDDVAAAETPVVLDSARVEADAMANAVGFEADSFSVYGVVETETIEATILTGDGKTLKVTVTYDEDAQIPEDATLEVKEIQEGDEEWFERSVRLAEVLSKNYGNVTMSDARFLSISIMVDGTEYEPKAPVQVKIEYVEPLITEDTIDYGYDEILGEKIVPEEKENRFIAIHYTEEGADLIESENTPGEGGFTETIYDVDGFSDYDLVYMYDYDTYEAGDDYNPSASIHTADIVQAAAVDAKADDVLLRGAGDTPDHSKSLTDNQNGTYTIGLNVTGDADTDSTHASNVNVVMIYDISTSMTYNQVPMATGGRGLDTSSATSYQDGTYFELYSRSGNNYSLIGNDNYTGTVYRRSNNRPYTYNEYTGQRYSYNVYRADAGEKVLYDFVHALFGYQNADDPTNIQASVVTFAGSASTFQNWTSSEQAIVGTQNNPRMSWTGAANSRRMTYQNYTNWQAALQQAQTLLNNAPDKDPTYVVFITDGRPQTSSSTDAYANYRNAADEAAAIETYCASTKGAMYGIYAYGKEQDWLASLMYSAYNNQARPSSDIEGTTFATEGYYKASDSEALTQAINEIFQKIVQTLGVTEVAIADGTTNKVQTSTGVAHLLDVDTSTYQYWLTFPGLTAGSGGTYTFSMINPRTGDPVIYTVTPSGDNITISWTDPEDSSSKTVTYPGKINAGNTLTIEWTKATSFYNYAPPAASFTDGSVDWNLHPVGTLLDGVQYTVTFDCYPSQETLDLIADLKNGDIVYNSLDPAIKQYLGEDYKLKTNTTATLSYVDTRVSQETKTSTYENPDPQPVNATEEVAVSKKWKNTLDNRQGWVQDLMLYVTRDGITVHGIELTSDNHWTSSAWISYGILTEDTNGVHLKTTGHHYSFAEDVETEYYWVIKAPTVRPMLVNNEIKLLKLLDAEKDTIPAAITGATGDYAKAQVDDDTYYKLTIDGNVYYYVVIPDMESALTATNHRRSYLDVVKTITGNNVPKGDKFPFTMTVVNGNADTSATDDPHSDAWVWFSIWDTEADALLTDPDAATANGLRWQLNDNPGTVVDSKPAASDFNGYFCVPSGTSISVGMQSNYSLRFLNLPEGSTYAVSESTTMPKDGYSFVSITGERGYDADGDEDTDDWTTESAGTPSGQSISGTIEYVESAYKVTVTNKWNTIDIKLKKVDENGAVLDGSTFTLSSGETTIGTYSPDSTDTEVGNPVDLGGLGIGTYKLTETVAPTYYDTAADVYFQVYKDTDGSLKARLVDASGTVLSDQSAIVSETGTDGLIYTITVKDTRKTAKVKVTKNVVGLEEDQSKEFTFTTTGVAETVQTEKLVGDDTAEKHSVIYENVPYGTSVTVTETEDSSFTTTHAVNGGEATDGTAATFTVDETTVNSEGIAEVVFTNTRSKQLVKVYKYETGNENKALEGAIFTLTGPEGSGISYTGLETDTDGYLKFTADKKYIELPSGTYTLTETKAPDGYNPIVGDILFTVTKDGVTATGSGYSVETETETIGDVEFTAYKIKVQNSTGTELPNTGGSGTLPYTLGGIGLILASALMYGFRMRRRERRLN